MFGHDVREDVARVVRILAHHEMIDLWGHVSARMPRSEVVVVTPRFGRDCLPRSITGEHMLVTDLEGKVIDGSGALPLQFGVDIAVYARKQDTGAIVSASPQTAMAAAIARRALSPLTHMESSVAYALEVAEDDTLADVDADASASALANAILDASALHQPGIGVWTAGRDVLDCLMTIYHLEYLAQANLVGAQWQRSGTVPRSDSDRLWSQFAGHKHYEEFFAALDPGPLSHPYPAFLETHAPGKSDIEVLKAAVAFSCRALWERGTLVAFLEHISHRLPAENRFIMSAAKIFRDMLPSDMCVLDYDANWISGPRPPGFKWFHAQLLSERNDAVAVVHTHDLLGRVHALGQRKLVPAFRTGLDIAMRPLPAYPRCDLVVDADVRRQTIDALGAGPIVHEIAHGTDFVADTLEKATVDAIQREAFLRMHALAERFGEPRPLAEPVTTKLATLEFDAVDWWWFYAGEVGAPKRSAGGL